MAKFSDSQVQKAACLIFCCGQKRPKGPEKTALRTKNAKEWKQSRNKVQADETPTICKTRRKRNPSDFSQRGFREP